MAKLVRSRIFFFDDAIFVLAGSVSHLYLSEFWHCDVPKPARLISCGGCTHVHPGRRQGRADVESVPADENGRLMGREAAEVCGPAVRTGPEAVPRDMDATRHGIEVRRLTDCPPHRCLVRSASIQYTLCSLLQYSHPDMFKILWGPILSRFLVTDDLNVRFSLLWLLFTLWKRHPTKPTPKIGVTLTIWRYFVRIYRHAKSTRQPRMQNISSCMLKMFRGQAFQAEHAGKPLVVANGGACGVHVANVARVLRACMMPACCSACTLHSCHMHFSCCRWRGRDCSARSGDCVWACVHETCLDMSIASLCMYRHVHEHVYV